MMFSIGGNAYLLSQIHTWSKKVPYQDKFWLLKIFFNSWDTLMKNKLIPLKILLGIQS